MVQNQGLEGVWAALGANRGVLVVAWGVLGVSWGVLGASWAILGASWRRPGRVLGRLGGVLGGLERVLGASWGVLGTSWGVLGASRTRFSKQNGNKLEHSISDVIFDLIFVRFCIRNSISEP